MAILPTTSSRITRSTTRRVNERILRRTLANVERYCGTNQEVIARRLEELDREWDIERTLETAASLSMGAGLLLGTFSDRRWYGWSGAVALFLLLFGLFGWAPPVPVLRRLGLRTQAEIEEERDALRILRGDFKPTDNPLQALAQAHLSSGPTVAGAGLFDSK